MSKSIDERKKPNQGLLVICYSLLEYGENLIKAIGWEAGKPSCWNAKRMWNFELSNFPASQLQVC
jgi:hypothetical protein